MINSNHKLKDKDFSCFEHSKNLPRHNWYYFKEGFSPLLVEEAINSSNIRENGIIIDPFSGSGTTSLVASNKNINNIGFEVNPFMAFVAKTKQLNVRRNNILKHRDSMLFAMEKGAISLLENFSTFTENGRSKWLFNTDVLRSFEGGWQYTETIASSDIKNILKFNLIASVMDNCNAVKDGKCLRYKKDWQKINYDKNSFLYSFEQRLQRMADDMEAQPIEKKSHIILGDSRKKISLQPEFKFQLCVTSPPYLNSFDYTDIYRPELFLGKFVRTNSELCELRYKTLRSHIQVDWNKPIKTDFGIMYANVMNEIIKRKEQLWHNRLPSMIQAYFEDMENILTQLHSRAEKNASLWLVVSTSAYAGVEIPVDLILADIGSKVGWELEEIIVTRHMRNSMQNAKKWLNGNATSKRLRESIVVLRAIR